MRLLRSFQYPTPICLGLNRFAPVIRCRYTVRVSAVPRLFRDERDAAHLLQVRYGSDTVTARIIEGVAAVLDLLAADGDAVDDPAPIYELLAERCRHVRVALEVMTGCE